MTKYSHVAECPFCGQMVAVELPIKEPNDAELEQAALAKCKCYDAARERRLTQRLVEAQTRLRRMFPGEGERIESIRDLLHEAVKAAMYDRVAGITVKINGATSVKIQSKGLDVQIVRVDKCENSDSV